jgi:beta-glucosidase/6-phospho-beta-glucosidase/beta-galactosidase
MLVTNVSFYMQKVWKTTRGNSKEVERMGTMHTTCNGDRQPADDWGWHHGWTGLKLILN